ncbi:ATP-dependent Clp protease proteolytic subunit [Tabrizicola soli]|uniref:ATP-dependent Clp protease proteolytic subunit n=1 Tax=Tabrizicola soli TaxID=2185115 RepID=A0ABV7DZF5_9RHOB|nr:ATP-dependent Clp protease proteolytic subunit [Tabrizicola soli]
MTVQNQKPLQLSAAAPGKTWFRAAMLADGEHVVEMRGIIGDYEVDPALLIARLNSADQDAAVTQHVIRIDSPGGLVEAGVSLMTAISQLDKPVRVEIWGSCHSMATLISSAADKVLMAKDGTFMIHNPQMGVYGTAAEFRTALQYLDGIRVQALDRYTAKVSAKGRTREDVDAVLTDAGNIFTAAEALEFGWVDGILEDKREPLPAEEPAAVETDADAEAKAQEEAAAAAETAAAAEAEAAAQAEATAQAEAAATAAAEAAAKAKAEEKPTDAAALEAQMLLDEAAKAKMQADADPRVAAMKSAGEQPAVSTARKAEAAQDKPAMTEPAPWQARVAEMNRNFGKF